ncbi:MAG TPA: rhomboid family intramembrane serine protease [Chitinophagales bacterium]|nr:rhomboid family intramembrane serine protease [Chitinophagales bacterium]
MNGKSIFEDIKWQYIYGSNLIRLILINVAVFVVLGLINLPFFFSQSDFNVYSFFYLYSNPSELMRHPWGFITYMFVHQSFFHLLFNMLGMYWFGMIVEDLVGKSKIVPLYLYGGLFGGILFVLSYNFFDALSVGYYSAIALGASASVLAFVVAGAVIAPDYELNLFMLWRVKLKWIALAYVVLDLINIPNGNAGGHIAHIGGAIMGFVYIRLLQNGRDLAKPYYKLEDFFVHLFRKKSSEMKVNKNTSSNYDKSSTIKTSHQDKQVRLDAILDKINKSSYESLSKEEKDFLFQLSKED